MTDLCFLSANEAIAAFKSRRLSPVELTKALVARGGLLQPALNAFTTTFYERAIELARLAEQAYANGVERPLEGICFVAKDFHSIQGEITTFGSKAFRDFRPGYTVLYVQRLLDVGAILLARSTTPESAYDGRIASPLWGITRNPWNLDYSSGGSSGGSAVAVAAGLSTVADGTDGGGSIRIPASACGVVGYKPPFGRNPTDREHPFETMLHYGPIVRTVGDAAMMQNVTSGPHPDDPTSLRDRVAISSVVQDIAGARVALSMNLGFFEVDPDVRRNTLSVVEAFRELGCTVDDVDLGWDWDVVKTWAMRWAVMLAGLCGDLLDKFESDLDPGVLAYIRRGKKIDAVAHYRANLAIAKMYAALSPILAKYEVLICPTLAVPSVRHDETFEDFMVDGRKIPLPRGGWSMTSPFNLLSSCPVIAVPSGMSTMRIPTGIQIVGRPYDDQSVFKFAAALEAARPWGGRHPTL